MAREAATVSSFPPAGLPGHDPPPGGPAETGDAGKARKNHQGQERASWRHARSRAWCDDGGVPTLTDLARRHADFTEAGLDWLHALVSDWQLLADLSFADLVLWAPLRGRPGWVALAQMRPTTGPTAFPDDVVGIRSARREAAIPGCGPPGTENLPRGRPGMDRRRAGAARDHSGPERRPGDRRHRAVHQSQFGAHAEPDGTHLPAGGG